MTEYTASAWPYLEAQKLAEREPDGRAMMTFEAGFGPSGLPHLGTFAEVSRTTMVRRAYEDIMGYSTNEKTRLIVFSDDLDALRKVPDTVPDREAMEKWLGYSVSRIPDPWNQHESFAHHNNAMLCGFLDRFEFDYEFRAASTWYSSDEFMGALRLFHLHHDAIRDIIAPTLGEDRASTYSPFLPITPEGRVLQAEVVGHDIDGENITYIDPATGEAITTSIHHCKLQWKADWPMRWYAQEIDYEMCGKDLTDSLALSSEILAVLGAHQPDNMIYEMFLDENGQKIAKSKGNGLTMEQWLRYGSASSLTSYLFRSPRKAKKLHVELVPRAEDDLMEDARRYAGQDRSQQLGNSAHYTQRETTDLSYQLLLSLAETAGVESADALLSYVENQRGPQPLAVKALVEQAFLYYREVHLPSLPPRFSPDLNVGEALAIGKLHTLLQDTPDFDEETIQLLVYRVGNESFGKERLRDWFRTLYQQTLGRDSGPRFGALAVLLGREKTLWLLSRP